MPYVRKSLAQLLQVNLEQKGGSLLERIVIILGKAEIDHKKESA